MKRVVPQKAGRATHVAGFNAWRKLGRHVKKGEKGIVIIAPVPFRRDRYRRFPRPGGRVTAASTSPARHWLFFDPDA